jgi:hypothetical protein
MGLLRESVVHLDARTVLSLPCSAESLCVNHGLLRESVVRLVVSAAVLCRPLASCVGEMRAHALPRIMDNHTPARFKNVPHASLNAMQAYMLPRS